MRRSLLFASLLLPVAGAAFLATAEPPANRLITRPAIPTDEALARIGLKRVWATNVGTDGRRPGLASLQIFDDQLLAQTRGGTFIALDAETGARQWQLTPGDVRVEHQRAAGANRHWFFLYAGMRVFGVERRTGQLEWTLDLPLPLACAPSADEANLYLCTSDSKMRAYFLPIARKVQGEAEQAAFDAMLTRRGIDAERFSNGQPKEMWSFDMGSPLVEPPAAFGSHIIMGDEAGDVFCFENSKKYMADRFNTAGSIVAPIAQFGDIAYVASTDHHLYAVELIGGRMEQRWQFTAGSRILQKPMVIGDDLYVGGYLDGLHRLNRKTGERLWSQPRARKFLAATPRLVVAADSNGELVVLDRKHGTPLGSWNSRDYAFHLANDANDRIYIGNHNGLVVCLRDRDPACAKPRRHDRPLSSAMEAVAREFRKATQDAAKQQQEEKEMNKEDDDKPIQRNKDDDDQ